MADKDLNDELNKQSETSEIPEAEPSLDDAVLSDDVPEPIQDETQDIDSQEPNEMITVRPVKFQSFEVTEPNRAIKRNLDIIQDVSMHISVELGKSKATIKDVMDLETGSIVELDKIAGEQVEIYANNKIVARGEVIVIEDKFGVRVTSTNIPKTIV